MGHLRPGPQPQLLPLTPAALQPQLSSGRPARASQGSPTPWSSWHPRQAQTRPCLFLPGMGLLQPAGVASGRCPRAYRASRMALHLSPALDLHWAPDSKDTLRELLWVEGEGWGSLDPRNTRLGRALLNQSQEAPPFSPGHEAPGGLEPSCRGLNSGPQGVRVLIPGTCASYGRKTWQMSYVRGPRTRRLP